MFLLSVLKEVTNKCYKTKIAFILFYICINQNCNTMADGGGGMTNQISQWAGGGATTTLGAVQLGIGLYNQKHTKRPTYEIPPEVAAGLNEAQRQALQGMPEEQRQQAISDMQRGQAYSLSQASSRKGGLQGIAALNENQNRGYATLANLSSQMRAQKQAQVFNQLQNVADYKGQKFQLNQLNPYYEKTAQNQAMIGAGMQNISQGFQASNSGGNYAQNSKSNTQNQAPVNQSQAKSYYASTPQTGGTNEGQYDYMKQQNLNSQDIDYNQSVYG